MSNLTAPSPIEEIKQLADELLAYRAIGWADPDGALARIEARIAHLWTLVAL